MVKKITTFRKASEFLDQFVRPIDYERFNEERHIVSPLERMKYLLSLVGNPHKEFPSVVVSGTSGKGSTTMMISNILTKEVYKTGMTISPHLESITERFQINNQQISKEKFVSLLNEIMPVIEKVEKSKFGSPSYFEIVLTMVFIYFAREKVDIAVVEVGLEGKFDGTNVLDPLVFVLTNISLDHTQILGNSIEEIAYESIDRIRNGMIVVTGVTQKSTVQIVEKKCKKSDAKLLQLHKDFDFRILKETVGKIIFDWFNTSYRIDDISLSLIGFYQAENASLAIAAILQLEKSGFDVSEKNIRQALSEIKIPGRFETFIIQTKYKSIQLILDGAHNPAKMKAFLISLEKNYKKKRKIFIIAFSKGHKTEKMINQIAKIADIIIVTQYETVTDMGLNRTEEISKIIDQILKMPDKKIRQIFIAQNPKEAFLKAIEIGKKEKFSILVATGSLYLVGSLRKLLQAGHL